MIVSCSSIDRSLSHVCLLYVAVDPLTLERLFAQRPTWNNDNDNTAENIS